MDIILAYSSSYCPAFSRFVHLSQDVFIKPVLGIRQKIVDKTGKCPLEGSRIAGKTSIGQAILSVAFFFLRNQSSITVRFENSLLESFTAITL